MKTSYSFLLIAFVVIGASFKKDTAMKLKHSSWIYLDIPEPSDITIAPDGKSFYIVSDDDAAVYQINLQGDVLRKSETLGIDLEGACARPDFLYVVDETPRKIYQLDYQNLTVQRTFHVPYAGGRNKGFESITYNEHKKCFVLITERDPIYIFELDNDFRQINEYRWNFSRDISATTFHNGFVYLLSDEDMTVFKCDSHDYRILERYKIDVHNPEGIVFENGQMLIVADDLERLYFFSEPK